MRKVLMAICMMAVLAVFSGCKKSDDAANGGGDGSGAPASGEDAGGGDAG